MVERLKSSLVLLGWFVSACGGVPGEALGNNGEQQATAISWEELRASAFVGPNGNLVVENDLAFANETTLRRFWEEDRAPHSGGGLSIGTVTAGGISVDDRWSFPQNFRLTYCVGSTFSSSQLSALLPALDAAAAAWSRRAGVRFQRVTVPNCNYQTTSVIFDVQYDGADPILHGYSFLPSWPRSQRTLFLYDRAFTSNDFGRTLSGVVTHELGHILGFRHEHLWVQNDLSLPERCRGDTINDARHVTALDPLSVMFYPECRTPPGGGYHVTNLDAAGCVSIYGLAPALISSVL